MPADLHNKILASGFAAFSAIFFFTFALLLVVSAGVFVALGITSANETGDSNQAGIGILGGVFAIVFYVVLGLIFVLPTAVASWKLFKQRERARSWGIIAAILIALVLPLGTILGIYGLWFFFSAEGKLFYLNFKSNRRAAAN
jgi:membrane-anchored glycerophosphoryl diester phosphodiesterase (GDPDase)